MVHVPNDPKAGPKEKKAFILQCVAEGKSIADALRMLSTSRQLYEYYRKTDSDFRDAVDHIRMKQDTGLLKRQQESLPPFEEFSEKYFKARLFWHQQQWIDCLEGRDPRDLHFSQRYVRGEDPRYLMINTPPDHAKSTTITVNYLTYQIIKDPNIKILIVSKTTDMAKKFLRSIKDRLVGRPYADLQRDWAPAGGFEANSAGWTQDAIYVSGDIRDSGEKDPTVQALGITKQIYGARADIIVLDDCIDSENAANYEKQIDWLQNMVDSRLEPIAGQLLVVGTRVAPVELYSELLRPLYWSDGVSPFTYLTQPAVLEFADEPSDWKTLWPKSNMPPTSRRAREAAVQDEDGLWPRWDGPAMAGVRKRKTPRNWSMIYMQEQVADDSVFKSEDVIGCVNGMRHVGPMLRGTVGHRPAGMDGLHIIAGLDPAIAGCMAAVVVGLDRHSGKRYVLDVHNQPGPRPDEIRSLIKNWTDKYRIQEWRIEKNAFQGMLTQDPEVREYLAQRGCLLGEHHTGANKWDADWGVAAMSVLFEGWQENPPRNIIELPRQDSSEAVRQMIEQLVTWEPTRPGEKTARKTDIVMALWFAMIRCQELFTQTWDMFHRGSNPYAAPRDKDRQIVLDIDTLASMGTEGRSWF